MTREIGRFKGEVGYTNNIEGVTNVLLTNGLDAKYDGVFIEALAMYIWHLISTRFCLGGYVRVYQGDLEYALEKMKRNVQKIDE